MRFMGRVKLFTRRGSISGANRHDDLDHVSHHGHHGACGANGVYGVYGVFPYSAHTRFHEYNGDHSYKHGH